LQTLKAKKQGFSFFANIRTLKKVGNLFIFLQTLKAIKQGFYFFANFRKLEKPRTVFYFF